MRPIWRVIAPMRRPHAACYGGLFLRRVTHLLYFIVLIIIIIIISIVE